MPECIPARACLQLWPGPGPRSWLGRALFIDDDLGRSGGGTLRPGLERRRLAVREGRVDVVLSLDAYGRAQEAVETRPVDKAMDYMLMRCALFARFFEDGRICLTDNAAHAENRIVPRFGLNPLIRRTAGLDLAA